MRRVSIVLLVLSFFVPMTLLADPLPEIDAGGEGLTEDTSAPLASSTGGLRNGFSLSAGQQFGGDRDISGTMFGVDWRIGWQINEPMGVYVHSHMSFGSVTEAGGLSGPTGTLATAIMGEYTLPVRAFLAAGVGYGVLNNPNGPVVAARAGYYPLKTNSITKARRLNVAIDYRSYSVSQGYGRVNQIQFTLGYDRF